MSADVYNRDSGYLTITETGAAVTMQFDVTLGADSTGSQHSIPIYIGDMNDNDAWACAVTNATSDINVLWHFSYNLRNWVSVATVSLDAVSNTAKYDTLGAGTTDDLAFHRANWLVVECDGQAGANQTDLIYLTINFKKDVMGYTDSGQPLKVVRKVQAITNP
jgi:hypothetical protein